MRNILLFMLLLISTMNAKEYVNANGWKVIYNPAAIDQEIFNSIEFRQFSDADQNTIAKQYFKENITTISPAYNSLGKGEKESMYKQYILDVLPINDYSYQCIFPKQIDYIGAFKAGYSNDEIHDYVVNKFNIEYNFGDKKGESLQEISCDINKEILIIKYRNIGILISIIVILIGISVYKRKFIIQLYQRINSQPTVVKRFSIIVAIIWVIMNHLDFWEHNTFHFSGDRFNEYFMVTYMPMIVIYGIYWVISGIKKDS